MVQRPAPIHVSSPIPRYRDRNGPAMLSAGFRPFFMLAALWSAAAVPLWLAAFAGQLVLPASLPPVTWHVHEMVFGFGAAAVAGFLLTAIPNWTGRLPLQNLPLAVLVALWALGRFAVLCGETIGAAGAAAFDLSFPIVFMAVVAREIIAGRNWRNLPMLVALGLLAAGNTLVHLEALEIAETAALGNRLGIATLLMLISLVGGRIIPSFTRNWLTRERPDAPAPATFGRYDGFVLAVTGFTLALWVGGVDTALLRWPALVAGLSVLIRLARWRGTATLAEPLLWVLHLGYAWVGIGLLLLATSDLIPALPATAALHALTAGAIGTMVLAVMTRASLGHTGRPLLAGPWTTTIYALVTAAALLRVFGPAFDPIHTLWLAGLAWSGAFGLFAAAYFPVLARPRAATDSLRPI